ncbi:hypothetical protein BGW36DRAFT_386882 [Talaromyces proteolyticus]|uniref:Ricin B lectin domain-containing protein n=1 Tax=Talaromyces proteolyticus TaxID=1131652 RepID=A0AAD4KMS3_9EURO|nr:uncharacterized protein BGW36DRAFT_386882 [Talaromyces proteolyticus]KAH8692057.1 hypothetical protein BGW36DRAFT_386882 [Talaromyces proteolyticus]
MEYVDSMSSTTTDEDGFNTPTHTSVFDGPSGLEASDFPQMMSSGEPPSEGSSYIILDPETGLVIALRSGMLCLVSRYNEGDGRIQWRCVRHPDRWYGFRNEASNTFIGHNDHRKFIAGANVHDDWEHFWVEHHRDGGHILLVKRAQWFRVWFEPMKIGGNDDTQLVTTSAPEEGTAWRFIRVDSEI